jgi:ATP-binding cassette subfamily F protein 3
MLAGVVRMDKGHRKLGHQVKMGYFSQTRTDVLNPTSTALDELMSSADGNVPAAKGRSLLGLFNFHGDDVFKQVSVLSGGEKSRLILAKLLINPPNFILLDEPTTHLDIHGVEALTKAFRKYKGTLCFISHDLFFIKEIANHIVEVQPGDVKHYHGGMDYFLDKKSGREASAEAGSHSQADMARAVGGTSFSKKKKKEKGAVLDELAEKHRDIVRRLNTIKTQLRDLGARSGDAQGVRHSPQGYPDPSA